MLGTKPVVVADTVIETHIVANKNPKKVHSPSEFTKKKARSSWLWQRWLQRTPSFKWIPKIINMCSSNPTEPLTSSGSTLTIVPSALSSCDAGGSTHSVDC